MSFHCSMICLVDKLLCRIWIVIIMLVAFLSVQLCAERQALGSRPSEYINNIPSDSTLHGWFLNIDDTAHCNSNDDVKVVAWDFCYHSNSTIENNITVAVWRRENNSQNYTIVNGSRRNITIQSQPDDRLYTTEFICQEWMLNAAFPVKSGDVVGAHFTEDTSVYIIGKVQGQSVMNFNESASVTTLVASSNETKNNYGLYLEAILVGCTPPISPSTPVPSTSAPNPLTSSGSPSITHSPASAPNPLTSSGSPSITHSPAPITTPLPTDTDPTMPTSARLPFPLEMKLWIGTAVVVGILVITLCLITTVCITLCYKHRKLRHMTPHYIEMSSNNVKLRDVSEPPTVVMESFTAMDSTVHSNTNSNELHVSQPTFSFNNISPSSSYLTAPSSYHSNPPTALSDEFLVPVVTSEVQMQEPSAPKEKPLPFPFKLHPAPPGQTKIMPSDMKRSRSAAEVNYSSPQTEGISPYYDSLMSRSDDDQHARQNELCESVESNYPYVVHSREALGHTPLALARSLPTIFQGEVVNSPNDSIYAVPFDVSPHTLPHYQGTPVYSYPYSEILTMWGVQVQTSHKPQTSCTHFKHRSSLHHSNFGSAPNLTPKHCASFFIPRVDSDSNDRNYSSNGSSYTGNRTDWQTNSTTKPPSHIVAPPTTEHKPQPRTKPVPIPRTKLKKAASQSPKITEVKSDDVIQSSATSKPSTLLHTDQDKPVSVSSNTPDCPTASCKAALSSSLEPGHDYMKIRKDTVDKNIRLYQHLISLENEHDNMMQPLESEKDGELSNDKTNNKTKDQSTDVEGSDPSDEEYLESLAEFIGSVPLYDIVDS